MAQGNNWKQVEIIHDDALINKLVSCDNDRISLWQQENTATPV